MPHRASWMPCLEPKGLKSRPGVIVGGWLTYKYCGSSTGREHSSSLLVTHYPGSFPPEYARTELVLGVSGLLGGDGGDRLRTDLLLLAARLV